MVNNWPLVTTAPAGGKKMVSCSLPSSLRFSTAPDGRDARAGCAHCVTRVVDGEAPAVGAGRR
jgi:hypothetical protein